MPSEPYTTFEPGQLITAEAMNEMQSKIRDDILGQIGSALAQLDSVPNADDAAKLEGETSQELLDRFLERALADIPSRTGYLQLFKVLREERISTVEHGLGRSPLVDVYELDAFQGLCAVDDERRVHDVRFYLYHTSEKRLRHRDENGNTITIDVESTDEPVFKVPFATMLDIYGVAYTASSSLGDLETEFWTAFFASPNDQFDPDDYCHSPWFERCCREERTVESLKEKDDWDELWLKMRPMKTINIGFGTTAARARPAPVTVSHLGFNEVAFAYMPSELGDNRPTEEELRIMALLKA
jgi:hypothetical protein